MPDLAIATAHLKNSRRWTNGTTSWAAFVKAAAKPADRKECGNYLFGVLDGTSRTKETILSRSAVTLDADKARADLPEKVARLGCAALVHTTYSHTPEGPRYRVSLPLSRWVTPNEYRILTDWLMDRLGRDQFDKGSREPERYMFRPSTPDPETYGCWEYQGPWLDVDQALEDADLMGPVSAEHVTPAVQSDTRQPADVEEVAELVADALKDLDTLAALPLGERDHREEGWDSGTFRAACTLVRAANCDTGYTLTDALADFTEHCPTDNGFGADRREAKWADAVDEVAGGVLFHRSTPAEDFDTLPPGPESEQGDRFGAEVEREARRLRIQEAARALVAAEHRATVALPTLSRLGDFLAEPDEDTRYRVDGLWPTGGRVVLAAQQKSGKTTLTGNLLRSLADGEAFLDRFAVEHADRTILLDNELSPGMIRRWLRDQGIGNVDAVDVLSMRGRLSTFNILEAAARTEWARLLGPADVLVFDCLRPALDALGLSEDKDAGRFLEALDELVREAGIGELLVVHHMGHTNERSRGDSRIQDWPDATWKLVREDPDDLQSARFFSANGRDVNQPEARLAFNQVDRHLVVNGGSRASLRGSEHEDAVMEYVTEHPGCSQNEIETSLMGRASDLRQAIKALLSGGRVTVQKQGQKRCHYPTDSASNV